MKTGKIKTLIESTKDAPEILKALTEYVKVKDELTNSKLYLGNSREATTFLRPYLNWALVEPTEEQDDSYWDEGVPSKYSSKLKGTDFLVGQGDKGGGYLAGSTGKLKGIDFIIMGYGDGGQSALSFLYVKPGNEAKMLNALGIK
ncbi:hypothetical protein Molly5_25 [Maribacter phage Molly_5]|uniref:Uncharacterized protein n=1 Tax=Maribacter phage Molly_1 TaxID=2745685 RepID=A0A8E4UYE0_9CAUD|nr:hypothetical protein M1M29_gp025 [Maribacter phage Molly_1]QQO97706.1 hypothetical protein Molly2_25 [Maribacter phage Molly_2]QQO97906.1 hypothetical protein Molly3_25 [Maribacter phage Molly_3]QQO98106.1 hypothetical protein Molly4_25 [Maribacter phage Molly_4]QQO98306.1 hypothetical protein Molly5_25 [Maribacter phage Molly_5]QQO97506.1 hypothetical protein Molly1_25 [Maribacter phage Molly_1]